MKSVLYFLEDAHEQMSPEQFYRHFIDAMPLYQAVFKNNIINAFDGGNVSNAKSGEHYFKLIHEDETN